MAYEQKGLHFRLLMDRLVEGNHCPDAVQDVIDAREEFVQPSSFIFAHLVLFCLQVLEVAPPFCFELTIKLA